jgi:hypothetical protein
MSRESRFPLRRHPLCTCPEVEGLWGTTRIAYEETCAAHHFLTFGDLLVLLNKRRA